MSSTLATLETNIRIALQETTANFYSTSEIYTGISNAYKKYSLIMLTKGIGYFVTTTNLSLTASTETISLASLSSTFFSISSLERRISNGTQPLHPDVRRYRPNITTATGSGDSYLPTYKLRGTNLVLEPAPLASETGSATAGLKLDYNYIPTFPTSASSSSFTFDANFPTIYESMVEDYAAIYCLENKDGSGGISDIQTIRNRLDRMEADFMDSLVTDDTPDRVEYSGNNYSSFY